MKAATVYEHKGKLYIHSSSKTITGIWVINAPVLTADKEDAGGVGRSIKECLAASREGVQHPKSFANLFNPVLQLAGVRAFGAFVKSAKCVEVETNDGITVTLIPTRNEGVKGGFSALPNKMLATFNSDEELGSAAIVTLAISE